MTQENVGERALQVVSNWLGTAFTALPRPPVQQPARSYVDLLQELRIRGLRERTIDLRESSIVRELAHDLLHVLDLEVLRHYVQLRDAMLQNAYLSPQVRAISGYSFRPEALNNLVAEVRELLRTIRDALGGGPGLLRARVARLRLQ